MKRQDIVFGSAKTYKAIVSTAFRQHRADSHCNQIHGYALSFQATFEAEKLDDRAWVVDFGSLRSFKGWLDRLFDHTTLVAADDPHRAWFEEAAARKILDPRYVDATGCESMALMAFENLEGWLVDTGQRPRVRVVKLEVSEHDGNSAYVRLKSPDDLF